MTTLRPYSPEDLKKNFSRAVASIEARGLILGPEDYSITQNALSNLVEEPINLGRFLEYVTGISHLEDMSEPFIVALMRMIKPVPVDYTWVPCDEAIQEAESVIKHLDRFSSNDLSR